MDSEYELSQEKSRVGLGDIYAEDFLAKVGDPLCKGPALHIHPRVSKCAIVIAEVGDPSIGPVPIYPPPYIHVCYCYYHLTSMSAIVITKATGQGASGGAKALQDAALREDLKELYHKVRRRQLTGQTGYITPTL